MKRFWKIFRWVGLVLLLVGGYSVYRIGLGKPFTINELANRQAPAATHLADSIGMIYYKRHSQQQKYVTPQ